MTRLAQDKVVLLTIVVVLRKVISIEKFHNIDSFILHLTVEHDHDEDGGRTSLIRTMTGRQG